MSRKEVPRPGLVKLALAGQITNQQGAAGAKLTVRQFQRLKARVRAESRGLLHRRRGQPSPGPCRARCALGWRRGCSPSTATSMTATPPRSSGRSKACARASVRRIRRALGLPAKSAASPGNTAAAGRRPRGWAPSCCSTAVSSPGWRIAAPR